MKWTSTWKKKSLRVRGTLDDDDDGFDESAILFHPKLLSPFNSNSNSGSAGGEATENCTRPLRHVSSGGRGLNSEEKR